MITCMCDDLFVPDLMHVSFFVCRPIAKRTKAELESDVKSTGMLMGSCGVPADFPCGPWLVDPSKEPWHTEGFDTVEKRMVNDLKRYCANRKTPANPADRTKWTTGNFVLAVLSRSTVNALGNTTCGTEKKFGCTGKGAVYKDGINGTGSTTEQDFTDEIPHKGANNRCKCEFVAEYVTEANGVTGEGTLSGWVVKEAIGGLHELKYKQGSFHALETDQYAINISGVRRKGSAILQTEPLHSMGKTLKAAHLGSICINKALTQLADDNGTEIQWNLDDIRTVFGISSLEGAMDFTNVVSMLDKTGLYHPLWFEPTTGVLERIFYITDSFLPTILELESPCDLVFLYDTTFGTNRYSHDTDERVSVRVRVHWCVLVNVCVSRCTQCVCVCVCIHVCLYLCLYESGTECPWDFS